MKKQWIVFLFLIMAMVLTQCNVSFSEGANPGRIADMSSIPSLDSEGTVINVSESEKQKLERLMGAANPSDVLVSFDHGDDIDHVMWVAGFAAAYSAYCYDNEEDSDLFALVFELNEDAGGHFAGLWAEYYDGWSLLDEANPPPPDILPYGIGISDARYIVKNECMQSLIKGIYGREMLAPEDHIRYYDGYFYFGHIEDKEGRLWFGYDYIVDAVHDLTNGYYIIEGKAALYDYADGSLEDTKAYEALVKKDAAADYSYFLIAQRFTDFNSLIDDEYDDDDWDMEHDWEDEYVWDGEIDWWFDEDDDDADWVSVYPGMFADGWEAFDATLNQRMATRTGPGTKYTEDHGTLPQSTEVVVYAQEETGGTTWVLVEFVRNNKLVRAYTGMKRINAAASSIPITTKKPKAAIVTNETTAFYGPGTTYMALEKPVARGVEVLVYGVDRDFALIEYTIAPDLWMRSWVPVSCINFR